MLVPLLTASLLVANTGSAYIPVHPEPLPQRSSASSSSGGTGVHPLRFNWVRDGTITALGGVLGLGGDMLLRERLAPGTCRWCDADGAGQLRLNPLDSFGRRLGARSAGGRASAGKWSNLLGFGVLPVGVFGVQFGLAQAAGGGTRLFAEDAFIVLQSVVLSSVATNAVKYAVGRRRPFVHALSPEDAAAGLGVRENNLSFYSGHTSLAFSLAVSAGTVAELRGYEKSWLVWAVGMPLAATVPLLRMRADKHYLTDVAMGAVMGSAFGVGVPLLLHGRRKTDKVDGGLGSPGGRVHMRVRPMPNGLAVGGTF